VTSESRLLPTPSGTSNSHVVPVRLRVAARVLIHEAVALLGSLGYPLTTLGDITQRSTVMNPSTLCIGADVHLGDIVLRAIDKRTGEEVIAPFRVTNNLPGAQSAATTIACCSPCRAGCVAGRARCSHRHDYTTVQLSGAGRFRVCAGCACCLAAARGLPSGWRRGWSVTGSPGLSSGASGGMERRGRAHSSSAPGAGDPPAAGSGHS
jgi:hypothetical protein